MEVEDVKLEQAPMQVAMKENDVEAQKSQGKKDEGLNMKFVGTMAFFQLITLIFFGVCATYEDASTSDGIGTVLEYYSMYQDVHVMIFIGFGLLMTFLRHHGFNSMGMTFLIGVQSIQLGSMWGCLIHNLFDGHTVELNMDIETLIFGDFAAGAVLISYGAVLGRVNPTQILWMLFFELIFYSINEYIGLVKLEVVDVGGSMFVHTFGAYFGLAFSYWMGPPKRDTNEEASSYNSDIFAIIGTVFLWMFWPSFNGALAPEAYFSKQRVIINTVLSLSCSCSMAFLFSHVFHDGKFDMVHIQNATLAGGVAVGTSADLVISPVGAMLIGVVAGILSTFGYAYITPYLDENFKIHDVCGVHNLHGMPGVLGAVAGTIASAVATDKLYGDNVAEIFTARATRNAGDQAIFQFLALVVTLALAIVGGIVTAFIVLNIAPEKKSHGFNDDDEWEMPEKDE